jgi:hypothetical protein
VNITQILNNNCFPGANNPRYVVLHGTAGGTSAQEIATYFQGTATSGNPVSATYVIGQDGTIVQCNNESDGAWGNGVITGTPTPNLPFRTIGDGVHRDDWWNENANPNNISISIEHCKPDDQNATALTSAQQASSFALIKDICTRHNIPMRFADSSGGITGHFSIDVADRSLCPNTYPWQELWQYLNENEEETMSIDITTPGVSQFFKASSDDKTWQCTNGKIIGGAILDFYKSFGDSGLCGLTHLGLPVTSEQGVTGHAGVTVQEFERAGLRYDPQHLVDSPPGAGSVYVIHTDQDPRTVALQSQITALNTLPATANLQTINGLVAQASTAIAQAGTAIAKIGPLSQVQ